VQTAYAELHSNGWVESTVGRGTFVSPQPPALPPAADAGNPPTVAGVIGDILQASQGVRSLASASPDPALFPADEFWACLAHQRDAATTLAGYGPGQGDARLRMALVEVLRERGVAATAGEILVTAGVTQGLALAIAALAQPGDVVLVEQPTYIGFLHQLRSAGLQPVGVPLDEGGLRLDVLERLAAQLRPRLLYTVPSFQNPTGLCADRERRDQVLVLARTHARRLVQVDAPV
jgi:DNA-binding transcriptional MocR family regulator